MGPTSPTSSIRGQSSRMINRIPRGALAGSRMTTVSIKGDVNVPMRPHLDGAASSEWRDHYIV